MNAEYNKLHDENMYQNTFLESVWFLHQDGPDQYLSLFLHSLLILLFLLKALLVAKNKD